MSKRAKTKTNTNNILNKIPYIHCFEDCGMFEIDTDTYSVTYSVTPPDNISDKAYLKSVVYDCMKNILMALNGFTFRFTIRNSHISKDEYLENIHLPLKPPTEDNKTINSIINDYNAVLDENVDIGHNNFKTSLYLTVITQADVPDDALAKFKELEQPLISSFKSLYNHTARLLSLDERLEVLYDIYHPDIDSPPFGSVVSDNGFSVEAMKRRKLTTKDIISPSCYEINHRDYFKLGNKFGRMLFINSIPVNVNDSLLSDLISISSNSMLSVTYQPIDAEFGFNAAVDLVKENTSVHHVAIRDTIEDRKKHRTERIETMINENEDAYFNKSALTMFTDSTSKDQPVILVTFVIALFSDSLEELERDTTLLKISASKYTCPIKTLDFQQHEGFVSILPLGGVKVDVPRTFNISRLSKLLPLNIQSLFDKEVTLQGLNEINDNFVLIDRKNYPIGLISGTATSGKTFAMKREILNTLMSTDDYVVVVAPHDKAQASTDYKEFVTSLNGVIHDTVLTDLFSSDEDYGLRSANDKDHSLRPPREILKQLFLEAFITLQLNFHKNKRLTSDELQTVYDEVNKEAVALAAYDDYVAAVTYTRSHGSEFKLFNEAIQTYTPTSHYPDMSNARLNLIYTHSPVELLLQIDYLWNCSIVMKKSNRNLWIYVDGMDEFLYSPACNDYLISLLEKCKLLKVPFTMVVQDSAKIIANNTANIEFDYLLDKTNYFKLLSQGVKERKRYIDKLNIPRPLVPYITDVEPGEGIIITPSDNISFNDRFEIKDNPFYRRFAPVSNN